MNERIAIILALTTGAYALGCSPDSRPHNIGEVDVPDQPGIEDPITPTNPGECEYDVQDAPYMLFDIIDFDPNEPESMLEQEIADGLTVDDLFETAKDSDLVFSAAAFIAYLNIDPEVKAALRGYVASNSCETTEEGIDAATDNLVAILSGNVPAGTANFRLDELGLAEIGGVSLVYLRGQKGPGQGDQQEIPELLIGEDADALVDAMQKYKGGF